MTVLVMGAQVLRLLRVLGTGSAAASDGMSDILAQVHLFICSFLPLPKPLLCTVAWQSCQALRTSAKLQVRTQEYGIRSGAPGGASQS